MALKYDAKLARTIGIATAAVVGTMMSSSVVARTVEYLQDLAAVRAAAEDQGIAGPFSEAPAPGGAEIVLETAGAADHRVVVASQYCQAYRLENAVSALLKELVARANPAPEPTNITVGGRTVKLRVVSGSTVLRCMGKSDLTMICKNRVRLTAIASVARADGSTAETPLAAQVEREGRMGGFCGNIARYTGIVTREAGIDLLRQAQAL